MSKANKAYLLDNYRSCLLPGEVDKFKKQITKRRNSPACPELTTTKVSQIGIEAMISDGFKLVKGQLDV